MSPALPSAEFAVELPETAAARLAAARLARAAMLPNRRAELSPLYLHGPTGVGKTHLAEWLVREWVRWPGQSAQLVPVRELEPDSAEWGERDGPPARPDLLVLEDVQQTPERGVDSLCSLLDDRARRRLATAVTANAGPALLTHLPGRLTSRFSVGLVVPLEPVGAAGRRAFAEAVAARRRLGLTPGAIDWLAARPTGGGLRPLLGSLNRLASLARGAAEALDAATVERLLAEEPLPPAALVAPIVKRVAAAYRLDPADILGAGRTPTEALARQVSYYLARRLTGMSYPQLGQVFGGRDHTTILHGCRAVEARLAGDAALRRLVGRLGAESA